MIGQIRRGHYPPFMDLVSIPGIGHIQWFTPPQTGGVRRPSLLIEIPHGATRAHHYTTLRDQLQGSYPDGLEAFFFVNTDVGAPELGVEVARNLSASGLTVLVLTSEIPRTFIDCNRVIDADPDAYRAGGVTPGIPPYVKDPTDLDLLRSLHRQYVAMAERAFRATCGAGGTALMLHSYAPRSVGVEVDDRIVDQLRWAYQPEVMPRWPLRPQADVISTTPEGTVLAPGQLLNNLLAALAGININAGAGQTYPLHPSTQAARFAAQYPEQTLCLEIRRDLLVSEFTPFSEMIPSPENIHHIAGALTNALKPWLSQSSGAS